MITSMPPGEWARGKTKHTDEKVRRMAETVSRTHRDPLLRKHLDDQKKLNIEELTEKISAAHSKWTIVSGLDAYTRLRDKNILCSCPCGHEQLVSVTEIIGDTRCRTCNPKKAGGELNPAYVDHSKFANKLLERYGRDAFAYDATQYKGMYSPLEFECTQCRHVFTKRPTTLLQQKHGCPKCAYRRISEAQVRSSVEFFRLAREVWGDRYTYHPRIDQKYGNADLISRTCNVCNVTQDQIIPSLLGDNGCSICSQKKKHTKESFIAKSEAIWGKGKFDYTLVTNVSNNVPVTLKCTEGHTFQCSPSNHFTRGNCPRCSRKKFISAGETEWLNSLMIPNDNRNIWLNVNGQKFNVDALINGTVYEYYGDYWHGNTKRFDPQMINAYSGLTMQELHEHTVEREQLLRDGGYVVISMWESDWMTLRKTRVSKVDN